MVEFLPSAVMSWNSERRAARGEEAANEAIMERIDSLREQAHHHLPALQ